MFSQAIETACTLLLAVNNELKDVAKGFIIQPQHRKFHGVDMPHDVHRVRVSHSLPGCGDLYPPNQPADEDHELKVAELRNHVLLWPKALIRLRNATVGSATSQGKVTPPVAEAVDPPEPTTAGLLLPSMIS